MVVVAEDDGGPVLVVTVGVGVDDVVADVLVDNLHPASFGLVQVWFASLNHSRAVGMSGLTGRTYSGLYSAQHFMYAIVFSPGAWHWMYK